MPNRSPPVLVELRCPFCDKMWFRIVAAGNSDESEQKCRCNQLITYRVVNGSVVVISTAPAR